MVVALPGEHPAPMPRPVFPERKRFDICSHRSFARRLFSLPPLWRSSAALILHEPVVRVGHGAGSRGGHSLRRAEVLRIDRFQPPGHLLGSKMALRVLSSIVTQFF